MTQPVRSLRLIGRNSQSLDNITGSSGEIFYDRTLNCLRLYSGAANSSGGEKIADRDWVISQNYLTSVSWSQVADKPTLFSGNYNDLTNKPAPVSLEGLATETYVGTAISNLVSSAPETLNTLDKLAFALGDDPNFSTTITTQLGLKIGSQEPTFYGVSTFTGATIPFSLGGFTSSNNRFIAFGGIEGMYWKPDGTRFYTHDGNQQAILEWICSAAWSPSTATAGVLLNYGSLAPTLQYSSRQSLYFKSDGTRIFILVNDGQNLMQYKVASLDLSTPWDIGSTVTYTLSPIGLNISPSTGFTVSPSGTSVYISYSGTTYQYNLSTAWDLTTINATAAGSFGQSGSLPGGTYGGGIAFNDNGSKIYYVDTNGGMFSFNLDTAYIIASTNSSSLSYFNLSDISIFSYAGNGSVQWSPDGLYMLVCAQDNMFGSYVWRYDIASSPGLINADNITATALTLSVGATIDEFSSDPTFTDNSSTAVPTESAVRAYLDRRLGRNAEGTVVAVEAKIGPEYAVTDSPQFIGTVSVNNLEVTGLTSLSYQNISPAGSTQETAAAITANLVLILNTAPSGGIRLPANVPYGTRILVRNSTAGARNVYPPTGEEVAGAGSVNAALSQTGLSWREYIKTANPLGTGADWWWALTPT